MHIEEDKIDPSVLAQMGYEHRDLHAPSVLKVGFWFVVFVGFGVFLSWVFFQIPGVVPKSTLTRSVTNNRPPVGTPILENNMNNTEDIATLRQGEQRQIEAVGPVESEPGFYHIPLDKALDMVATDPKGHNLASVAPEAPKPATTIQPPAGVTAPPRPGAQVAPSPQSRPQRPNIARPGGTTAPPPQLAPGKVPKTKPGAGGG